MIIVANLKADLVLCQLAETAGDSIFCAAIGLIDVGRAEADVSIAGREHEVAGVQVSGGALKGQCDLVGVGARSDAKVVFELSLAAVVGQIDSGVDGLVIHTRILRDATMPLGGIIADEIVALAGKKFGAGDAGGGIGSVEAHADDVVRRRRARRGVPLLYKKVQ